MQTLGTAAAGSLAAQLAPVFAALAAEGITTVFVAGATGSTGRRVVQQLRGAGYNVRAGVRVGVHITHCTRPTWRASASQARQHRLGMKHVI